MSKTITVEALIASPPTSKCQETLAILEELIQRHPDELRLVGFKRGIDLFPTEASMGMKNLMQKGAPVPAVIVNGVVFVQSKVPNPDELEARVQEGFARTRVN